MLHVSEVIFEGWQRFFIETAKIICGNIWVNQLFSLSLHEQTV